MEKLFRSKYYYLLLVFLCTSLSLSAKEPNMSSVTENSKTEYNTPGDGSLTDSNILYVGRWDKSNSSYYQGHWTGAYIRVDFTGTSIKINLANSDYVWLIVKIDNEAPRAVLANDGKQLNLSTLSAGRHTILIGEGIVDAEILFKGFTLDAGAVTYKPESKLLIEYIGDSITTIGGPSGMFSYNYAWQVADLLGCDHTQISYSGLALCSGYSIPEINRVGMDSLYFSLKNYKHFVYQDNTVFYPWNFDTYTPDLVFMFLGTNDSDGVPWIYNATDEVFSQRLDKFLKRIRAKFPNSHIAVMNPFTGVFKDVIPAKIQELKNAGETKIHFINSTGWLTKPDDFTDGIHLNTQGTAKVVDKLYTILNPLIQSIKDGTEYVDTVVTGTNEKFYLNPSSQWLESNAKFGAIFKNGTTEEKVMFTLNSSTGMYELPIPVGTWPQICMKRYSSDGIYDWGGFATFDAVQQKQLNNFISYNKVYNCIEVKGWADGTDTSQYITSTYPVTTAGITIRFKKPTGWPLVNIHAWDEVGVALPGFNWPGNLMQEDSNNAGWYYYTFDSSVKIVSFQFNKGDADGLVVKEHVTQSTSYNEDGSVNNDINASVPTTGILSSVYSSNNHLVASFEGRALIELYTVRGQLLRKETAIDKFIYPVSSGAYLLRVNGKAYKVLVP